MSLWHLEFYSDPHNYRASPVTQRLKRLPGMRETWVRSLGREDPLEKEMAAHSSVPAWRIPGVAEPGGLPSTGSHRVGHDWSDLAAAAAAVKNNLKSMHKYHACAQLLSCVWLSATPWTVCSPSDSSVHGILQARILKWAAIPFSRGSFQPRDWMSLLHCRWILYLNYQGIPYNNYSLHKWMTP